jgi:hypothetical protein
MMGGASSRARPADKEAQLNGIRGAVGAFLLTFLGQADPEIEKLLERLSDDRVEARERAVEALSRLDPSCLPGLRERARILAPEARARLAEAIRRLEVRAGIPGFLPPDRSVTLHLSRRPAREALRELVRLTDLPIDLASCPDGHEVGVDIDRATPLEALAAILRPALLGWQTLNTPDWRGRVRSGRMTATMRIHEVVPYYYRPRPVQYLRAYEISAGVRSWTTTGTSRQEALAITCRIAPGVLPCSESPVRLTCAQDASGRDLLPFLTLERTEGRIMPLGVTCPGGSFRFKRPESCPEAIARLAGMFTLRYPRQVDYLSFKPGGEGAQITGEALGCRMSLVKYARAGRMHTVGLQVSHLDHTPFKGQEFERIDLPFETSEWELLTEGGERLLCRGSSSGFCDRASWTIIFDFLGSKEEAAREIRFPYVATFLEDVVDFELRDVPLSPD